MNIYVSARSCLLDSIGIVLYLFPAKIGEVRGGEGHKKRTASKCNGNLILLLQGGCSPPITGSLRGGVPEGGGQPPRRRGIRTIFYCDIPPKPAQVPCAGESVNKNNPQMDREPIFSLMSFRAKRSVSSSASLNRHTFPCTLFPFSLCENQAFDFLK